ncbi:MAG: hypothetical protein V3S89_11380 [Desulfobacterales bacterium]
MSVDVSKFEGPEKRLKIILTSPQQGWRANDDGHWDRVVNASHARIISKISTDDLDAYLLSESSLFVWKDRVLIITCGKTNLLDALDVLLAFTDTGNVAIFSYERNNFIFPGEQPSDFQKEIEGIGRHFSGDSRRLGARDHDHVHLFCASGEDSAMDGSMSLQVLMHDLDPSVMNLFSTDGSTTPDQARSKSALDRIYPHMKIDHHLFAPYGYSLNGVYDDRYFSVHITPQRDGSYASFETNVREADYPETIGEVLSIFRPGRFSLVRRSNEPEGHAAWDSGRRGAGMSAYEMTGEDTHRFKGGYSVGSMNWCRRHQDVATGLQ